MLVRSTGVASSRSCVPLRQPHICRRVFPFPMIPRGRASLEICLHASASSESLYGEEEPLLQASSSQTYTVEDAIEHIGFGKFQWGMLGYIGLIWFADAMELMMLSFIGPAVRGEFHLDATSESVLTSCVFVGMILGSSFWGALADTRGRRPAFLYTALGSAALAYLSAVAPNFWVLVVSSCRLDSI